METNDRFISSDLADIRWYKMRLEPVASEAMIRHIHELLRLMSSAMTRDNRFESVYSPDMEERTMTMCEVLGRVEKKGEDTILSLIRYLLLNDRTEDAKKATEDKAYRNKLLSEVFGDKPMHCQNGTFHC